MLFNPSGAYALLQVRNLTAELIRSLAGLFRCRHFFNEFGVVITNTLDHFARINQDLFIDPALKH